MALQENHHIADLFLLFPRVRNHLDPLSPDALHPVEVVDLLVNDLQGLFTEGFHNPRSHHRTDAFDEAGSEILLNPDDGGGNYGLVADDLELLAELRVRKPCALDFQHFTRHRRNQVAYNGNRFPNSGESQLGYRVAGLFVRIGNSLNLPFQDCLGLFIRIRTENISLVGHRIGFVRPLFSHPVKKQEILRQPDSFIIQLLDPFKEADTAEHKNPGIIFYDAWLPQQYPRFMPARNSRIVF